MSNRRLQAERAFYTLLRGERKRAEVTPAKVGNGAGVIDVPNRAQWVYVRLHADDGRVNHAQNLSNLALENDDMVDLQRITQTGRGYYRIVGYSTSRAEGVPTDPARSVPNHAPNHERRDQSTGGGDPVEIFKRMIVPLRAQPQAVQDMTLYVNAGDWSLAGVKKEFAGGNSPAFVTPTCALYHTVQRYDRVYLDSDNNIVIVQGTPAYDGATPTKPTIPTADCFPLELVWLTKGTTVLTEENLIKDERPLWFVLGAGGGGEPITPVDTATIDLTVSGTGSHTLQADVSLSTDVGNAVTAHADGLYVPYALVTFFNPDNFIADADSDHFNAALSGAWSTFNISTGTADANAAIPHCLCLDAMPSGTDAVRGVIRTLPTVTNWQIMCKAFMPSKINLNYAVIGIGVTANAAGSSLIETLTRSYPPVFNQAGYFTDKDTWGGAQAYTASGLCYPYLRLRFQSGTLYKEISEDGACWHLLYSLTPAATPLYVILFADNVSTGATVRAAFDWYAFEAL